MQHREIDPDKYILDGKLRSRKKDQMAAELETFYNKCHDPETGQFCGDEVESDIAYDQGRRGPKRKPRSAEVLGNLAYVPISDNPNEPKLVVNADDAHIQEYRWKKNTRGGAPETSIGGKTVSVSNLLMGDPGQGKEWDHINRDPLDNRRENLRLSTRSQNQANKKYSTNTSGYKGVSQRGNRWRVQISKDGKIKQIGTYGTPEEAARAYNEAAKELHGEHAVLNIIEGDN